MEPISYKQFSNMLLKKNKIYDEIVRRNGKEDPLRKTLVIIDEAHKLYSPTVAASEKPNTDILEEMVQHSYERSGKDSVRILLMTATPYTEDGMEMIKLLNLIREENAQLPDTFEDFGKKYLDDQGYFTPSGAKKYKDAISGYISYLNRSQDARNFAHPVLENVVVPLTYKEEEIPPAEGEEKVKKLDKYQKWMKDLRERIRADKKVFNELKKESKGALKGIMKEKKEHAKKEVAECKEKVAEEKLENTKNAREKKERGTKDCGEKPVKERKACKEKVSEDFKEETTRIKEAASRSMEECKKLAHVEVNSEMLDERQDDLMSEMKQLEDMIQENMKELAEVKEIVKQRRDKKKEMTEEMKMLREEMKKLRADFKELKKEVEKEKAKIKKIKDKAARKKAQGELRHKKGAELRDMHKEIKEIRSKISLLRVSKKVMMLQDGKSTLGDVSQATALEKRCGI